MPRIRAPHIRTRLSPACDKKAVTGSAGDRWRRDTTRSARRQNGRPNVRARRGPALKPGARWPPSFGTIHMSSILTNNGAMVALQTLKGINSSLSKTQTEISTGKSVSSAKDNSTVWMTLALVE
uniref:flagellin N-terminal helical domain-containing protein n=2 Tax=Limimaricola soesokkakensis TaxID=1343159 RepID=UPI0035CA958F